MLVAMRPGSLRAGLALLPLLVAACGGGGAAPTPGTVVIDNPVPGGGGGPTPNLPGPNAIRATLGPMHTGRYAHTATLLVDARVLITGGTVGGTTITDTAEVYLPTTDTFLELSAAMQYPRSNHTATRLLDGRVLLAGGWVETSAGVLQAQARAEVFDPVLGTFTEVGQMSHGRVDHAAARLPDGRVLITGGSVLNGENLSDWTDAEYFDPATGQFTPHPNGMVNSHSTHACLDLFDGRFLVAAGSASPSETFDVATQGFAMLNPAAGDSPRFNSAYAVFASGGAVIAGGDASGTVLYLRPGTALIQNTGSPLSRPRHYATATRISANHVLVAGGVDFANDGLILGSCDLLVEGGLGGARCYATQARFPVGMAAHSATALSGGRILFCGGLIGDDEQNGRSDAFVFTP
jgi:hypothetical protein